MNYVEKAKQILKEKACKEEKSSKPKMTKGKDGYNYYNCPKCGEKTAEVYDNKKQLQCTKCNNEKKVVKEAMGSGPNDQKLHDKLNDIMYKFEEVMTNLDDMDRAAMQKAGYDVKGYHDVLVKEMQNTWQGIEEYLRSGWSAPDEDEPDTDNAGTDTMEKRHKYFDQLIAEAVVLDVAAKVAKMDKRYKKYFDREDDDVAIYHIPKDAAKGDELRFLFINKKSGKTKKSDTKQTPKGF